MPAPAKVIFEVDPNWTTESSHFFSFAKENMSIRGDWFDKS